MYSVKPIVDLISPDTLYIYTKQLKNFKGKIKKSFDKELVKTRHYKDTIFI